MRRRLPMVVASDRRVFWIAAALLLALAAGHGAISAQQDAGARIAGACGTVNPYFVTALSPRESGSVGLAADPAIVAFRSTTAGTGGDPIVLARHRQVGAIYGLAYHPAARMLYAAAYHKLGVPFGPGGPGAIYRIDLATGLVTKWASLRAGPDRHGAPGTGSSVVAQWVGRTSLGDIDLSDDDATLYAANLYDNRIYLIATADGAMVGSFENGAARAPQGQHAHLFGLGFRDGWLYHGVVLADYDSGMSSAATGIVYRSDPDGGDMQEIGRFDARQSGGTGHGQYLMAILADIEVRSDGAPFIGIRNRYIDMTLSAWAYPRGYVRPLDLDPATSPFWFGPQYEARMGDVTYAANGGLAAFPGAAWLVQTAGGTMDHSQLAVEGAFCRDWRTGEILRVEALRERPLPDEREFPLGTGDVEALCPRDQEIPPEAVASATRNAADGATATLGAVHTEIAATLRAWPTPRKTPRPRLTPTPDAALATRYVPTREALSTLAAAVPTPLPATATVVAWNLATVEASCEGDSPYLAAARFVPSDHISGALNPRRAPVIFGFHDTAGDDRSQVNLAFEGQTGTVFGLAYDWRRQQLYASAYVHAHTDLGDLGPGGIYQADLRTGMVRPWALVAAGSGPLGAGDVGRAGLGDLEISSDGSSLFATDLDDGRVYRFSVPDGALAGVFSAAAGGPTWPGGMHPFGLGYRDGWLYQGLVDDDGRASGTDPVPAAYVIRSRADGAEMAEIARLRLDYDRVPGWSAWDAFTGPMLTDIEFTGAGRLILGLRDRINDTALCVGGLGDILPSTWMADRWGVITNPEVYADGATESTLGSLASISWFDEVVTTNSTDVDSALWFRSSTGVLVGRENLAPVDPALPKFGKEPALGDVELLCGPPTTATPTTSASATSTPTVTPSSTPTASPTATPRPTASSTATPTVSRPPRPVYLPLALREQCVPGQQRIDVALVIDASTSMLEPTSAGPTKLETARAAVRTFLDQLHLDAGDQAATIAFNAEATVLQTLTTDRAALGQALDRIRTAQQTRIHRGIEEATKELTSSRHRSGNVPAMIVLTDGRANPESPEVAVAQGALAKAAGITVFTIGIGNEVDFDALERMASQPAYFYRAPKAEDLEGIYREIARVIPCPPDQFWGHRP
jgi:Mg-chelatase subunit ChlD